MKKVYLLFSVMLLVLAACQSLPTPKSNMVVIWKIHSYLPPSVHFKVIP